jgi:hypothetical protein
VKNKPTGVFLTAEELAEVKELAEQASRAPVMTVRSDIPTFSEMAWKRAQDRVNELAVAHGLPAREAWNYGVTQAGEFMDSEA